MTRAAAALALAALVSSACEDLRDYVGAWEGSVAADPMLQKGFAVDARLALAISAASSTRLDATVTLPGQAPRPFEPIRGASADVLAEMRLPGEPLKTYVGYLGGASPSEAPYLAYVSLFAENRVEVRVIRGPDEVYGVFRLTRPPAR